MWDVEVPCNRIFLAAEVLIKEWPRFAVEVSACWELIAAEVASRLELFAIDVTTTL